MFLIVKLRCILTHGVIFLSSGDSYNSGPFHIDEHSGIITLHGYMNRNKVSYNLNITARDNGKCCGGTQRRESRGQVVIEVKDINNNAPVFPQCSNYRPEVDEMQRVGTPVIRVSGHVVTTLLVCLSGVVGDP